MAVPVKRASSMECGKESTPMPKRFVKQSVVASREVALHSTTQIDVQNDSILQEGPPARPDSSLLE